MVSLSFIFPHSPMKKKKKITREATERKNSTSTGEAKKIKRKSLHGPTDARTTRPAGWGERQASTARQQLADGRGQKEKRKRKGNARNHTSRRPLMTLCGMTVLKCGGDISSLPRQRMKQRGHAATTLLHPVAPAFRCKPTTPQPWGLSLKIRELAEAEDCLPSSARAHPRFGKTKAHKD